MKKSFNQKYILSILLLLISFFIVNESANADIWGKVTPGGWVSVNAGSKPGFIFDKPIGMCKIVSGDAYNCTFIPGSTTFQFQAKSSAKIGSVIKVKVCYSMVMYQWKDCDNYTYNVVDEESYNKPSDPIISSEKTGETINLQVGEKGKTLQLEELNNGTIESSKISTSSAKSNNANIASISCTSTGCIVGAVSKGSTEVSFVQTFNNGSSIIWKFPVNVSAASSNSNNTSIASISFLNLEGSTIDISGFSNCSGGSRGQACKYEVGKNYTLPTPSTNSKYGKFLGWSTSTTSYKYCEGSKSDSRNGILETSPWSGEGSSISLYAIYENTCSAASNITPIESTPKPGSTPVTGPSAPSNALNNINWAEALESGDCRYYNPGIEKAPHTTYQYSVNGKTGTGRVNLYSATEMCNNKDTYHAICYDPHLDTPNSKYEFDNYIDPFDGINAFPSAAGDSSIKQEAFIYYIYQKHGDEMENPDYRAAAVVAIRAYQMLNDGSSGGNGRSAAFWALANSWECAEGSSLCQNIGNVSLNFGSLEATAKSIYLEAKAVAETCTAGGSCSGLEEIGVKWSEMQSSDCDTEGSTLIKKIKGEIDGLSKYNDKYIVKELICPSGLTCELYLNGSQIAPGTNIAGNGSTKYEIWVKGSSAAFANASGDVGIRVEAYSFRDYHNVILLKPTNSAEQRLIIFKEKDGKPNTMDIVVADISDVTCGKCGPGGDPMLDPTNPAFNKDMYIAKCCDEPDALPEWCPQKDDVCVQAKWNLVCGADGDVYEIHEGISQKTGEINYKECIIDEEDPASNTYNIIKNRYCTISCKEDWEFQMPGDLGEHKAGTYMILAGSVGEHSLRVKGSRTCVAGNGNTKTSENEITTNYASGEGYFQWDLADIDNQIVAAINEYSEAAAYVYWFDKQSTKTSETKSYSCGGESNATCTGNSSATGNVATNSGTATLNDKRILNGTVRYRKIIFNPSTSYDANGKLQDSEKAVSYEWGTTSPKCKNGTTCGYIELVNDGDSCKSDCHGDVVEAKQDYGYDSWVSKRDSAKARYNQLIAERQEMIDDITECNTWENNFKYEPEITYTYQEQDYMNQLQGNNKFQIIGGGTPSTADKERIYRDQESKRDDYTQMGGNGQGDKYQQGNTNNIFTCVLGDNDNSNGFISSCRDDHQKMYYSSSILLEKQAEYSYEIRGRWYTVHDSGAAIYNQSEELKTQLDDKTSLVTGDAKGGDGKVLPISENTQPGDYNYQLRFVDVGQYNGTPDNQTLGRLIGGDDKAHTGRHSVFSALTGYKNINTLVGTFGQTYMCTYHIVNKNPCASKIKTEIISLLECPDGYRCSGYENDSGYIDVTGDVSFFVRTVSLNDINPNNRSMGSNWNEETINAIESLGDGAYAQTPEYSFTISPQGMTALKTQASSINYGGFELVCENDAVCNNPWLDTLEDIDGVTVNNLRS